MPAPPQAAQSTGQKIWFITGTDTGVGKTLTTALLLHHLRSTGVAALAMKPFSSGGREDAEIFHALQGDLLPLNEVNPFSFGLPLAPWLAARREGRRVTLEEVLDKIAQVTPRCEWLLIEGCGGWLTPLGEGFGLREIAARTGGSVLLTAPNRLGVINQVLLTAWAMPKPLKNRLKVVLMGQQTPDLSAQSNPQALQELLGGTGVFCIPFLGYKPLSHKELETNYKKVKKVLAALIA